MQKQLNYLLFIACLAGTAGIAEARAPIAVDAITTEPLHVRSGPGKQYKAYDVLPPEFPLVVGSCTRMWCQVYYSGMNGWSSLPYLAFKKGGKHYNDPQLGPFYANAGGSEPRKKGRHKRVMYSVNNGQTAEIKAAQPAAYNSEPQAEPKAAAPKQSELKRDTRGHAGWWTNYQRPDYNRVWQPRWWQKKQQ